MKEIEKLADTYLKGAKGYDPYYENDYCQNNYTDMRSAYEAGFRKAREMIASEHSEKGYSECQFDYWPIMNVGENEVE